MLSTWVYQYVHFSDRCGACEGCVHGGNCFDSTPLPPSPFLAPSPPWVPRLSFDLTFLENDGQIACISVQLVKGQPRLMRWADGGMSVVFTYGGSDALWLLCLGDSPVVLHDRRGARPNYLQALGSRNGDVEVDDIIVDDNATAVILDELYA